MAPQKVVIVGGGIGGPSLAYWLGKHGFSVVVIERAAFENQDGQVVDIEGPCEEVVARMGILDEIREKATREKGVQIVNEKGRVRAMFPAGDAGGASKDIEIMRPVLGEILYKAANESENVEFRFGSVVTGTTQTENGVTVEVQDRASGAVTSEDYDFLVACDGLRSRTRDSIFGAEISRASITSLHVFTAFFSIPREPDDGGYSKIFNMPGRRTILIKPLNEKEISVLVIVAKHHDDLHEAQVSKDIQRQKEVMAKRLEGEGWQADRISREIMKSKNFYFEEVSQVKLDSWSKGRCVLLGDTAWCPSPLTGQGTNSAILGAYVLADKLVEAQKEGRGIETAFEAYEKQLRPYVARIQTLPWGGRVIKIVNPDSKRAIWLSRTLAGVISSLKLYKYLPDTKEEYDEMPKLE